MAERKRNYDKEYADYHARPEQVERRSARNKSRRVLMKEGAVRKGDGKDVDHKDQNPKNMSLRNLRVQSPRENRSLNAAERKRGKVKKS